MSKCRAVALAVSVVVVAVVASGCSTPSQAEQRIEVTAPTEVPTVRVLPTPTGLPTTAPVADEPSPGPTPITLAGGRGIVVPTETPTPVATGDGADDEATPEPTPEPTEEADSAEPTPTRGPAPTRVTIATPTVAVAPTSEDEPDQAEDPEEPVVDDSVDPAVAVANGGEVYTLNCSRCHGEQGFGSFQASGLRGVAERYSTAGMIDELTNGHPVTFGFGNKLTPGEISDVVAYVLAAFS